MADPDYDPALDSDNNYTDGEESVDGLPAGVVPMHQHEVSALESIEENDNESEDEDEQEDESDGTQEDNDADANNQPLQHDEEESSDDDGSTYDQGIDDDNPQTEADDPTGEDGNNDGETTQSEPTSRQQARITGVPPNDMDEMYGQRTRQGLRQRKQREYSKHLYLAQPSDHTMTQVLMSQTGAPTEQIMTQFLLEHVAHTQYSVNKGLKVFGEPGAEAVIKEMKQLHDREVGQPVKAALLTPEEKRKSLEYLMFLKKKRCRYG
ncbi:hypothetical protein SEMRO_532_G161430.1 [Seminavis robusta]|uniref:Uncharacterized protein n=1 Tax=Seminavis robusta TaxID=568900 RepID=A0A9N8E0P6_9STRA|nr:hypothetical protein SEMRO_532_G161430.1 [Seminavis robusta]|eukprot:Sro532_g161430.1 n/a (265) ;mRNA; r:15130-16100